MKALSVLVLTRDNAGTLGQVLASVDFADEIVVVDSGSTDATLDIARAAGARILERAFTNFAEQRNAGWAAAQGRWVLSLDSDEVLDTRAKEAVRRVIASEPAAGEPVAWSICPVPVFLGRPLVHGGVMETYMVRLALRTRGRWEGAIHERLVVDGPTSRLAGIIEHHTSPTVVGRLHKVAGYAVARAEDWRARGVRTSALAAVWQPVRFLVGRLTVRGGFRDGVPGVVWWWLQATELLVAHMLLMLPRGVTERERAELGSDSAVGTTPPEGRTGKAVSADRPDR